jgi:hypothetical protein
VGKRFGEKLLDFFCRCVELQQEAIWLFLMYWKRAVGIKDLGRLIAEQVYQERAKNVLVDFEEMAKGPSCVVF